VASGRNRNVSSFGNLEKHFHAFFNILAGLLSFVIFVFVWHKIASPMYVFLLLIALLTNAQDRIHKSDPFQNKQQHTAKNASDKPVTAVSQNSPSPQPTPTPKNDNQQSNTDRWFKGYVVFTGVIAAINLFMLIAMWRQKNLMGSQLEEMRKAREQSDKLIEQAAAQVAEMKAAGIQTGQLVEHAEHQVEALLTAAEIAATQASATSNIAKSTLLSAEATIKSAEAAKASAEAATKSANALVESERAWIHAMLVHESREYYHLDIVNYGRTVGHVIDIRFGAKCIVPYSQLKEPYGETTGQLMNILILPGTGFHHIRDFNEIPAFFESDWPAIQLGTKQAIFFLTINYKDVLGDNHASDFVYSYRVPTHRFEEIRELRKYT
jgi:hypothetical protein